MLSSVMQMKVRPTVKQIKHVCNVYEYFKTKASIKAAINNAIGKTYLI